MEGLEEEEEERGKGRGTVEASGCDWYATNLRIGNG